MTVREAWRFLIPFALFALAAAAGLTMWKTRPLGCTGYGYAAGKDVVLASCSRPEYGDYEQGMLFMGLSPQEDAAARAAEVVILGFSHAHVGFSTRATTRHAAQLGARIHNLSVSGTFSAEAEVILDRLQLRPRVTVISMDPFFVPPWPEYRSGGVLGRVKQGHVRQYLEYAARRLWGPLHRASCERRFWPGLCGPRFGYFRRAEDGQIVIDYSPVLGDPLPRFPAAPDLPLEPHRVPGLAELARGFLSRHGLDPACAIFTSVPGDGFHTNLSAAVAGAVGAAYVNPFLPGLATVDHGHLTPDSAEAWSNAFWTAAGPVLARCLGRPPG